MRYLILFLTTLLTVSCDTLDDQFKNEFSKYIESYPQNTKKIYLFYSAIKYNNQVAISNLLHDKDILTAYNNEGENFFHIAVKIQTIGSIKLLLNSGFDINKKDNNGFTPLFNAQTKDIVILLLSNGANPYIKADTGLLPIEYCFINGDAELISTFITNGFNINYINDYGNNLLMTFVSSNGRNLVGNEKYFEIIKLLIDCGIELKTKNIENKTILDIAKDSNDIELVQFILRYIK